MTCSITDTTTTAWAFNVGLSFPKAIGELGISGGVTETSTFARAQTKSVNLKDGECGYFTFIPIMKESCGSFTWGTPVKSFFNTVVDCKDRQSVGKCTTMGTTRPGMKEPVGDTVLVKVDCGTHEPLPLDQQDPAYQKPGVPLDRGVYNSYAQTFESPEMHEASTSEIKCETSDTSPLMEDCAAAMAGTLMNGGMIATLRGKKGGQWWAGYVQSCAVQIEYLQDWSEDEKDGCMVGLLEVMKSAAGMFDKCKDEGKGKIGGSRSLRNDGKCNGVVRFAATGDRQPPQGEAPS